MTDQIFYVDDTCALKSRTSKRGTIERTVHDVNTHREHPLSSYLGGIHYSKKISQAARSAFLHSGVPPKSTVLVQWVPLPGEVDQKAWLVPENELILLDRTLLIGDSVKRNSQDPARGTVIRASMIVDLLPPLPWHPPDTTGRNVNPAGYQFLNVSGHSEDALVDIPAIELVRTLTYHAEDFIICDTWVGRVDAVENDIYLRLSNGSVAIVEDRDELQFGTLADSPEVGDLVQSKKGILRRGRWEYGAYDANIEPIGFVAHVRPATVFVQWLCQYVPSSRTEMSPQPPEQLERSVLESGKIHIYDRTRSSGLPSEPALSNLEAGLGEKVQWRDLAAAVEKYDPTRPGAYGKNKRYKKIPKTASLGHDINTMLITRTQTVVTVLWQDMTTSEHLSTEVLPSLESDADDMVWPGEVVTTMSNTSEDKSVFKPARVGVVQHVDAKDRIAKVRWFPDASVAFAGEDKSFFLPGSNTGKIGDTMEDMSLYDIWTVNGLSRRVGDMVLIIPYHPPGTDAELYKDVMTIFEKHPSSKEWFGEIVGLGLDGLLAVRLGAAATVRDVRVPWECTVLAHTIGPDAMDDAMSVDDDDEDEEMDEDFDDSPEGVWVDENDHEVDDDENGNWTTDNEADDTLDQQDQTMQDVSNARTPNDVVINATVPDSNKPNSLNATVSSTNPNTFSYSTMFPSSSSSSETNRHQPSSKPSPFTIIDGAPPSDHHFVNQKSELNGPRLRRIQKEFKIIQSSLPDGIYVRTWESALDMLRVLILGPIDTPYEYAPFLIDIHLDSSFPSSPPQAFFHSWTDNTGPVNPNLYEDGKICLSLLNTWPGDDRNETWSPNNSTILQVLVSLVGLVLVKEPYYNEAGFEVRAGTSESQHPSALYSERTYFKSRRFISHALHAPPAPFQQDLLALYTNTAPTPPCSPPNLLVRAIATATKVIRRSENKSVPDVQGRDLHVLSNETNDERRRASNDALVNCIRGATSGYTETVSAGAVIPLKRQVEELIRLLGRIDGDASARLLETMLVDG